MKNELVLAFRNLLRNRRRSLSTLIALAIGLVSILTFGGFKANIKYSMQTAYVRTGGHLQVQHRDFFLYGSGNPSAYGISRFPELVDMIRADPVLKPLINVVTPKLQISGVAGNFDAGVSRTVIGTGYVPEEVNRMRLWNEFSLNINHPPFRLEGGPPDAAIVGIGVARVLQLCERLNVADATSCPRPAVAAPVLAAAPAGKGGALPADIAELANLESGRPPRSGSKAGKRGPPPPVAVPSAPPVGARVELLASSGRGAPNVAALTVVAAEDQGFKELDEVSVILQLDFAQRLAFGRSPPRATAIMVQLHSSSMIPDAAERLEELVAQRGDLPLVVRDFEELNPYYVQSVQLFDVIFGFVFVLIGAIVLFTVGNTMNAAVVERTVEIGTLRAIGLRQSGIRRLFLLEGLLLGCFGAAVGMVATLLITQLVNRAGLTWLPPGTSQLVPLQLSYFGENATIIGTTIGLILIATLSAWWPAWRAARTKVVEALRHA